MDGSGIRGWEEFRTLEQPSPFCSFIFFYFVLLLFPPPTLLAHLGTLNKTRRHAIPFQFIEQFVHSGTHLQHVTRDIFESNVVQSNTVLNDSMSPTICRRTIHIQQLNRHIMYPQIDVHKEQANQCIRHWVHVFGFTNHSMLTPNARPNHTPNTLPAASSACFVCDATHMSPHRATD